MIGNNQLVSSITNCIIRSKVKAKVRIGETRLSFCCGMNRQRRRSGTRLHSNFFRLLTFISRWRACVIDDPRLSAVPSIGLRLDATLSAPLFQCRNIAAANNTRRFFSPERPIADWASSVSTMADSWLLDHYSAR